MTTLEWNPPDNVEAEDALLGSLLIDNGRLDDAREAGVTASDFTRGAHSELFDLVGELVDSGIGADLVTLVPRLTGTVVERTTGTDATSWLAGLMGTVPSAGNATAYARIVHGSAEARRIGTALAQAVVTVGTFPRVGQSALDNVAAQLSDLACSNVPRGLLSAAEIVRADVEALDAAQLPEAQERRLRTGWRDLDNLLGDLRPGSMIVVAARPSVGKSSLATSLLARVAVEQARPSLLVTLEVNAADALRNVACALARVDRHALTTNAMSDPDYARFLEAYGRVSCAPIHVFDASSVTSARVRALARRAATAHGIELLVLDYLQLLQPAERRMDNREREVARMSADLKAAAREAGIAVVVLSQLNRAVENRAGGRPNLSDLRDSGSIEQDADAVLLLSDEETRDSEHGPVTRKLIHVAKNRTGPTGEARLAFHKPWLRFDSVDGFDLLPPPVSSPGRPGQIERRYARGVR